MEETQFQSTYIVERNLPQVKELIAKANPFEVMRIRQALENPNPDNLWYGTYINEKIQAVVLMGDQVMHLYAQAAPPMTTTGMQLVRSQSKQRTDGRSLKLFGPCDLVDAFWQGYRNSSRTLFEENKIGGFLLTDFKGKLNDAYTVRPATTKDALLVFDFLGEQMITEIGADLRKVGKESLEKLCSSFISEKRIWMGFQRGKPAFILKTTQHSDFLLLENMHFPLPMRRPKVILGILSQISAQLLSQSGPLLCYVDLAKEDWLTALRDIGYEQKCSLKSMNLR